MATSNYSLHSIPIAYTFSLIPHIFAFTTYEKATKKRFPLSQPRSFSQSVQSDQSLNSKTRNQILNTEAAHADNMEVLGHYLPAIFLHSSLRPEDLLTMSLGYNLGLFAATVVVGNMAGIDAWWLNALSGAYLAIRFVYNHVYIPQNLIPGALRSVVHFSGVLCIMTLFILAGKNTR